MKKLIGLLTLFILLLGLAACSTSTFTSTPASTTADSLSLEGQLLVGTLKLENTSLTVTAEQAAQLLPLWETLQSLAASGTAASAEVDAVIDQIWSTMTSEQLAGITAMNLTRQDLQTALTKTGTDTASKTSSSSASSGQLPSTGVTGTTAGGGPAGGNPPVDMGSAPMGAASSTGAMDIAQTASAQNTVSPVSATSNGIPPALINALVQLLQKKMS